MVPAAAYSRRVAATGTDAGAPPEASLWPYVPRLLPGWLATAQGREHRSVDGSLVLLDISGFTELTERLARRGREGAEEMSDLLGATFEELLASADAEGAELLKWGGDALLLLVDGPPSAIRACRAAVAMRRALRRVGRLSTSAGPVVLRASVGVHTGGVDLFLVGEPEIHRELAVAGPGASEVVRLQASAGAGQVVVSRTIADRLPLALTGTARGPGRLLVRAPRSSPGSPPRPRRPAGDARLAGRALPPQQRAHLLDPAREPEHRPAAVGFVRCSGTDDVLASEGSDAVLSALDEVVRNVQDACVVHGVGFHESDVAVNGCTIMLVAGAPRSSGDDADRLLQATRLAVDRAGRLPLRAGVSAGPVFAGDVGPSYRRTYSVKGGVVNLAARLAGRAAPGQLLASRELLASTRHRFAAADLPAFTVKGRTGPVRAVAVGRAIGRRHDAGTDRLLGRESELSLLRAALDGARAGVGHVIDVVGEPGIGKTRLVGELLAAAGDVVVLRADCEPYGMRTPFLAVRAILRAALGPPEDGGPEAVVEHLADSVERADRDLVPWLPLLGGLLGVQVPDTAQTTELDPAFQAARVEEVAGRFLDALLPAPTLIVIEDAHLMDESSASLLRRLTAGIFTRPWLLVATRRAGSAGFAPAAGDDVTTLELSPLTTRAARALVEADSDAGPLPPAAVAALVARAAGHPLFLRELVAAAGRGQDLAQLPASIEELITAQIDGLPARERSALRRAAVLGESFAARHLSALLRDDAGYDRGHDRGHDSGDVVGRLDAFLEPEGPGRLRFRHALIRDVAYGGLAYRSRRHLHEQAGALLERDAADEPARPELLSMHFFAAGRYDKAWRYGRLAGDQARAGFAHEEAAQAYARAADAARRAHGLVGPGELSAVVEALGDARFLAGHSAAAAVAFGEALRCVPGDAHRAAALALKLAQVDQRLGRHSAALRRLRSGLNALGKTTDPVALGLRARLATRYAESRTTQGRYDEARCWGRQAVADAEAAGQRDALAEAHLALHSADLWSGEPAPAPHGEVALWLFEDLADLGGQGRCEQSLAMRAVFEGRWVEAVDMFGRAARTFHRIGDAGGEARAVYDGAEVLVRQGRHRAALPLLEEALRVARAIGDEELVALALRESGRTLARTGDQTAATEAALARLADARDRFAALREPPEVLRTDAAVAECLLLVGRPAAALALIEQARAALGSGAAMLLPTLHRLRGSALLTTGELAAARHELEEGLRLASAPEIQHERGFLLATLARAAALDGAADAADLAGQAAAVLESLAVVRLPLPDDC